MRTLLSILLLVGAAFCNDASDNFLETLTESGAVTKAALSGLDGSIWDKTDNFELTDEEALAAVNGFDNKALLNEGLKIEGVQYHIIHFSPEAIRGEKDNTRFVIAKTTTGLVVALCADGKFETCSEETTKLASLIKGYGS